MTWTVVPPMSGTNYNVSDASLSLTEPVTNPQAFPVNVEEDVSQELFNLVLQDDDDSDYCLVNKASEGNVDGTDGMKAIGNKVDEPEGSLGDSSKTASVANTNKSPSLASASGDLSTDTAGKGVGSPNVSLGGTSAVPEVEGGADSTNYIYGMVKDDDMVELQYEIDLRLAKNLEMKHMKADGNSLFAAVASQVYGDPDKHELTRRICMAYMAENTAYFSQFVPGNFSFYCLRKSCDQEYGEILEAHALAHAYNSPVHIYFYSTEPFTVFHPPFAGNLTPIRLSFHHGGHYNSLIEPPNEFLSGVLHSAIPANVPRSMEMNSFGAEDSDDNDDQVMAALLNYVAGGAMPIGGSIIIGPGPEGHFNSCELALELGFNLEKVAAAYRMFGEDGSSMLHHLVVNDTYDYAYDFGTTTTKCAIM